MSFDPVMPPYNASDPTARFLSSSCLDFLLIELVPMAYRVTHQLEGAARELEEGLALSSGNSDSLAVGGGEDGDGLSGSGTGTGTGEVVSGSGSGSRSGGRDAAAAVAGLGIVAPGRIADAGAGAETGMDEDEERDAVFSRLEGIGYRVGQGVVEGYGFSSFWSPLLFGLFTGLAMRACEGVLPVSKVESVA